MLTEAPVLSQPIFVKDFVVYIDASHNGLRCVLMQEGKVALCHFVIYGFCASCYSLTYTPLCPIDIMTC